MRATSVRTSTQPAAAVCDSSSGRDWIPFAWYSARLLWLRQTKGPLPFGPKTKGFVEITRRDGPLAYHVEVYRIAQERRARFAELYGDRFASFRLEALQSDPTAVEALYRFCGFPVDRARIGATVEGFDAELVTAASEPGPARRRDPSPHGRTGSLVTLPIDAGEALVVVGTLATKPADRSLARNQIHPVQVYTARGSEKFPHSTAASSA